MGYATNNRVWQAMRCLVWLALIASSSRAQQASRQHFVAFDEGLSNRPICDFEQDRMGYLWIATYGGGVYRFDGNKYERFFFDWQDSSSINSNFVQAVMEDSRGRLWVGTEKGLSLFDRDRRTFRRIALSEKDPVFVTSLLEDSEGRLLIGTHGKRLIRLAPGQLSARASIAPPEGVEEASFQVYDLALAEDGRVYLATNAGLCQWAPKTERLSRLPVNAELEKLNAPIESVFFDSRGDLWVGSQNHGAYQLDGKALQDGTVNAIRHWGLTNARIMDIAETVQDGVWLATENDGVFLLDRATGKHTQIKKEEYHRSSIESNSIWALSNLDSSRLWLGYYEYGIGLYDPHYYIFEQIDHSPKKTNSLNASSVNGLVAQGDSILWIGMDGGGISQYWPKDRRVENLTADGTLTGLVNESVQQLFLDSKGQLWVACWDGGASVLPPGARSFRNFTRASTGGALISDKVVGFDEDAQGRIWIATFKGGVHYYDPSDGQIQHLCNEDLGALGVCDSDVRDLLVDRYGQVWVGATHGLFVISPKEDGSWAVEAVREREAFQEAHPNFDNVLALHEDRYGRIWIGTDGAGLYCYDLKTRQADWYNSSQGLHLEAVCGITEGTRGQIWVTGKSGLAMLDADRSHFQHFTRSEGLAMQSFNYNAVLSAQEQGRVYFGSPQGLNFIPDQPLAQRHSNVRVYLKNLRVFNETVLPGQPNSLLERDISLTNSITLKHDQNVFTLEYTGIEFSHSDRIRFAYYLEGAEENWNHVGNQRSATFTSLRKGNYVFHLKAMGSDGRWSEEVLLDIRIMPPWWQSSWALAAYVVLFLLGLLALYRLVKMRIKERDRYRYEKKLHQHQEELHNRKLQFFTNISHEFRTPLTLILNPIDALLKDPSLAAIADKLQTIHRNASRMKRLVDELMDFRKLNANKVELHARESDACALTENVRQYFEEEVKSRGIALQLDIQERPLIAWLDRGMVEKSLFNLLSNAVKLTPDGGRIVVGVSRTELERSERGPVPCLKIWVSDTGPGIPASQIAHVFERFYQVEQRQKWYYGGTGVGLEVVKQFVEMHHGHVEVASEEGEGSVFTLFFPLGKEWLRPEQIVVEEEKQAEEERRTVAQQPVETNHIHATPTVKADDELSELVLRAGQKGPTLLIVEDNYDLRAYLKNELSSEYSVKEAKDGEEGFMKAKELLPDLILTDVMMPGIDGFEMCRRIKADVKTSHIPLAMLTAKSDQRDQLTGINVGADVYITKPFDLDVMRAQLKRTLLSRHVIFEKLLGKGNDLKLLESTTSTDRDFLQRTIKLIYDKIDDPNLNVELLAETSHLSRSQLYRKIKGLTDLSATEFIRRIRLEEGRKLILAGSENISEVCYKVGFTSPSYFTKCYKARFGVLPTQDRPDASHKTPRPS